MWTVNSCFLWVFYSKGLWCFSCSTCVPVTWKIQFNNRLHVILSLIVSDLNTHWHLKLEDIFSDFLL